MKDFILACLMGLVLGVGLSFIWLVRVGAHPWPL